MDWTFWLQLFVRSALLLLAGLILHKLYARRNPAFRHRLLLLVFALLALLPVLSSVLPEIPILPRRQAKPTATVTIVQTSRTSDEPQHKWPVNWPILIWMAGVCAALVPAAAGAFSSFRISRRALPSDDSTWEELLDQEAGLKRRPQVLISQELVVPLTSGMVMPRILLPVSCENWDLPRRRAVLLHELAHVERRDVAAQFCVHVIAAIWWFQPLVWILRRSLRAESEFASDAAALASGLRPSQYAAELLAIAQGIGPGSSQLSRAGISMVRGDLEGRVRAILDQPRPLLSKIRRWIAFTTLTAVAIGAATVTTNSKSTSDEQGGHSMKRSLFSGLLVAAGLSAATIGGSIYDPSGAAIPDAKILLYNPDTGARQETVSGPDGKFALDGPNPGQYILRVEKPGFSPLFREFDLKADSKIDRGLTMNLGSIEERVHIAGKGKPSDDSQPAAIVPVRIGGKVSAANLVVKKDPVYPESAKAAGVQGSVELESVISKDGLPIDIRVLSSPDAALSQAAVEAVTKWRYRPTLLNGAPVEVVTNIGVNFTLSQ